MVEKKRGLVEKFFDQPLKSASLAAHIRIFRRMKQKLANRPIKLTVTEAYFFGIVFVVFPVLTTFEFHAYERHEYPSQEDLLQPVIYGLFRTVPYLLYFRFIVYFLIEKRYWPFAWRLVLFLLALNAYSHYVVYGIVMNLDFLPDKIVADAGKWFVGNTVNFSVIFVLRELLVVSVLGYYRHLKRQEMEIGELSEQRLQSELMQLKMQLHPHYFFNTLNSIYSLAMQRSSKTAPLVARHAEIMRYVLYEAVHESVTLRQEVDFLDNYVAVETIRYSERVSVQFETQGITDRASIEPLLLLPFVENTFKHGASEQSGNAYIRIVLVLMERELILETTNGKVSEGTEREERRGMGMANARRRLALLYPRAHELTVWEDEAEYRLQLKLELRET